MAGSIIKLFSGGSRLNRFWNRLEITLHEACRLEVDRNSAITQNELYLRLRKRFTLQPIVLLKLKSVEVDAVPSPYECGGTTMSGYRAFARVPFVGSPLLLQLRPEPGFIFPFSGKTTKNTLHLRTILPDLDVGGFAQEVEAELARIGPLLHAMHPTISEYDARLAQRVRDKISTF